MTSIPALMFVHLGGPLPPWTIHALRQARLFNTCPLYVVASARALQDAKIDRALDIIPAPLEDIGTPEKLKIFCAISSIDKDFRDGFRTLTMERFFAIEAAISHLSLENVFHLENDVMLYADVRNLLARFEGLYPEIAATLDNEIRCIPGLIFFRSARSIGALTDFILEALLHLSMQQTTPERRGDVDDMVLLAISRTYRPGLIDHLPIVPPDYPGSLRSQAGHETGEPAKYWRNFNVLDTIFDAAALGQFLGGVDPRNDPRPSVGFVNESCLFDPRLLKPRMIVDSESRRVPVIETASGLHRVANLHVHSKRLQSFASR